MAAILQKISSNSFSCMKIGLFWFEFHWILFWRGQGPMNKPSLFQIMVWHQTGDKLLSEPMMTWCTSHISITGPWWVKAAFCRDHFVYAPSQWEMMLQCNIVSHWLGACTKWSQSWLSCWGILMGISSGALNTGPVLLQRSDTVAILSANGSAAFKESCTPIG